MLRSLAVSSVILALVIPSLGRTRPRYGGSLRIQTQRTADEAARKFILEPLTQLDDAGRVQPLLAARWLSQNDGTRWQFWLRPGVRFHDGTPLTTAAAVQSLKAFPPDACPWRTVRVLGDSILFELDQPETNLPAILAQQKFALLRQTSDSDTLIGTGPFKLQSAASDSVTLAAFDDAWSGRPFLDSIEIRGGRTVRDQALDMGVGRADIVEVPAEQLRRAQQDRVSTQSSRPLEMIVVRIETGSVVLQDSRARSGLALTFDRNALFNVIFQKQGEVTASLLPSWLSGYSFLFSSAASPTRARELRVQSKSAGTINLAVDPGDSTLQLVAERLALNAREAGFQVQVVPDNGNHSADVRVERLPLLSLDAAVVLREFGAKLPADLTSDRAEGGIQLDELYRAERDLLQQSSTIPLLFLPRAYAANGRVRQFTLSPLGDPQIASTWIEASR